MKANDVSLFQLPILAYRGLEILMASYRCSNKQEVNTDVPVPLSAFAMSLPSVLSLAVNWV